MGNGVIYILDDFLNQETLDLIQNDDRDYEEVVMPGKSFWIKRPSKEFVNYICTRVSDMEGHLISPVLAFFREAKEGQDTDWRIHNDSIIEGEKPDRALVIYLSKEDESNELNGTAFWQHKVYGDCFKNLDDDLTESEFNNLITNDSNDLSKWTLKSVVGHKEGRLLSYPCDYFHSKYPNEFINSRQVFVMFYKT